MSLFDIATFQTKIKTIDLLVFFFFWAKAHRKINKQRNSFTDVCHLVGLYARTNETQSELWTKHLLIYMHVCVDCKCNRWLDTLCFAVASMQYIGTNTHLHRPTMCVALGSKYTTLSSFHVVLLILFLFTRLSSCFAFTWTHSPISPRKWRPYI